MSLNQGADRKALSPAPPALALIALIAAGCAETFKTPQPTPEYFQDAGRCFRQSEQKTGTRINLVGISDMQMSLGAAEPTGYRLCMEKLGWKADAAGDPFLAVMSKCRQSARQPTVSTPSGWSGVSLRGGFDSAQYEECLRNNGVSGIVIIHPVEPEPPK